MRPKASWAIDSEPIRARGIIVKYTLPDRLEAHEENVDFDVTECSSFQTWSKKREAKYATTDC